MDNVRLILFAALSVVILLLWQAWEQDFGSKSTPTPAVTQNQAPPSESKPAKSDVPDVVIPAAPSEHATVSPDKQAAAAVKSEIIIVRTDLLEVKIDLLGGTINEADLLAYPVKVEEPDKPYRLMQNIRPRLFIAQTGLLGEHSPDHHALFSAPPGSQFTLKDGENRLEVPLKWTSPSGMTVVKTFIFQRGDYVIDVRQTVTNASNTAWIGRQYGQFQRSSEDKNGEARFIYTYTGGVIYSPDKKYEKISFDDMQDESLSRSFSQGWVAMIQHYFLGAWIPPTKENYHYYSKYLGDEVYSLGLVSPEKTIAPGQVGDFSLRLFVGPKLQNRLEQLADGLELTVDYGFLTVISKPLFWLLEYIHKLIGNWGWSIAILTLLIKLLFYKLSEASYRSMANMRRLQPKLQALRERYGDDRQRMSQALMDMYKKEKINPFGGCLPMIVQIPVFIALYWVLLESVELRHAPFILWIHDLSSKDPYYILPLLMGVTMFVQQKLNPAPPDPVQAKVMMALPFIFTAFFAFFPSGLVLYWFVNNLLSIAQQWLITRRVEKAASKNANS